MGKGAVYGDIKALNEDRNCLILNIVTLNVLRMIIAMVTMHLNVVFALWNAQDRLDY